MATVRYLIDDVDAALQLYAAPQRGGARLRSAPVQRPGGRQVVVDDPLAMPVELFEARAS
jgi:hypothetical protein